MTIRIVVCAPVATIGTLTFDPHADPRCRYTKVDCPQCAQPMWLGERGRAEVTAGKAELLCAVCAVCMGYLDGTAPMEKLIDKDRRKS